MVRYAKQVADSENLNLPLIALSAQLTWVELLAKV